MPTTDKGPQRTRRQTRAVAQRGPRQGGRAGGRPDRAHQADPEGGLQEAPADAPQGDQGAQALVARRIKASRRRGRRRPVPGVPTAIGEAAGKTVAAVKGQVGTARALVTEQPETHLRNAQEELREEQVEIAIYTRIETFATEVGDRETEALVRRIRREEERMAKYLTAELPGWSRTSSRPRSRATSAPSRPARDGASRRLGAGASRAAPLRPPRDHGQRARGQRPPLATPRRPPPGGRSPSPARRRTSRRRRRRTASDRSRSGREWC